MEKNLNWITGLQEAPSPSVIEAERISEEAKEASLAIAELAGAIVVKHELVADDFERNIMASTTGRLPVRDYVAEVAYRQSVDQKYPVPETSSPVMGEPLVIPPRSKGFHSRGHRRRPYSDVVAHP